MKLRGMTLLILNLAEKMVLENMDSQGRLIMTIMVMFPH